MELLDRILKELTGHPVDLARATQLPDAGGIPEVPGVYAWWATKGAIADVWEKLHPTDSGLQLYYVGIAPVRQSSQSRLRSRICGNHGGNTGSSTFRFILASLLFEKQGWRPHRSPGGKYILSDDDNKALTRWQQTHLRLTWAECPTPWDIEMGIIASMMPPLNSDHNERHPFQATVTAARSRFRTAAQ